MKEATKLALRFNTDAKKVLLFRKESLIDVVDKTKQSNRMHKEYVIRLREIEWLLSKVEVLK